MGGRDQSTARRPARPRQTLAQVATGFATRLARRPSPAPAPPSHAGARPAPVAARSAVRHAGSLLVVVVAAGALVSSSLV
ncbi:MAG TPA: hypothetical protein VLZ77_10395, partial [Acidimicrobiales bacterium]|nr:hypothetical protein [Acidimicrobiales bacterium]